MTENSETLGLATILKDLEETISSASRVPLSGKVMVDGDAILEYVDKIYTALPEELKQAQRVLDAFAGSGALGLEALSRGAASALFFEADAGAHQVCRRNIEACGFTSCRLIRGDCLKLLPRLAEDEELRFDLVFADPPYNRGLLPRLMDVLIEHRLLAPDGLLVAETTARESEFAPGPEWQVIKNSVYGSTAVHYCQIKAME